MADKATCPACDSTTSAIQTAWIEGNSCPYCHLPYEAAVAFFEAQKRGADEDLAKRMMDAEKRAAKAEFDARQLRNRLDELTRLIGQPLAEFGEDRW